MRVSSAEETIQRLIFSLSELEQLGQTLISGHSNFNVSSKTYLRITLATLQASSGAIYCFHPSDNHLTLAASTPESEMPPIEIEQTEVETLLECSLITLDSPPESLQQFIARNVELMDGDAKHHLWVPLKIHDEFLGILSLGRLFGRAQFEKWELELLHILAHQISIAIAYSRIVEGIQSEKFRLFMLAESAPQICQLLQPEDAAEQVVHQAVALLDANVGGLMLIQQAQQILELRYVFPPTLISEDPDADDKDALSIALDSDTPEVEESDARTSLDMLAGVVKEGKTYRCFTKTDNLFGGRNLMAGPIQGRDGDIIRCSRRR